MAPTDGPPLAAPGAWHALCPASEVAATCGRRVDLIGHEPLAVFRIDDEWFVTVDTCTHGVASLCEGAVVNGEVECPFHAGRFDIRTGRVTAYPAEDPIRVFPAEVRDGMVWARLDNGTVD